MTLPYAKETKQNVTYIQEFKGYNHNLRSDKSQFYNMTNMTGDDYPVIATRLKRTFELVTSNMIDGIFAKEGLLWIEGASMGMAKLYYSALPPTETGTFIADLEGRKKRYFASIGKYVVIMPDKKIFDAESKTLSDIEFLFEKTAFPAYLTYGASKVQLKFTPCLVDGTPITYTESASAPEDTSVYWLDTNTKEVKIYNTNGQYWQAIDNVFLKMSPIVVMDDPDTPASPSPEATAYCNSITGMINSLNKYDTITLSFVDNFDADYGNPNGDNVIFGKGSGYLVIAGLQPTEFVTTNFKFRRTCPEMQYICSMNNRVWGCSSTTREVYACKLGDPTQWYNFAGLSSDSYRATIGSDGNFTGGVAYNNAVYFFKKDRMHKVYGDYPFYITEQTVNGVQEYCDRSLVVVNGLLFYKGVDNVMVFDGSLPVSCSDNFGNEKYSDAVAGKCMDKYYISMKDRSNNWHLFVYDTTTGYWHREDDSHFICATTLDNELHFVSEVHTTVGGSPVTSYWLYKVTSTAGDESTISWSVESGNLGLDSVFHKYTSKVTIRLSLVGTLHIYISYDNGGFSEIYSRTTDFPLNSFDIPINVRRCDHFRLKLSGQGKVAIYSIGYFTETGSEV